MSFNSLTRAENWRCLMGKSFPFVARQTFLGGCPRDPALSAVCLQACVALSLLKFGALGPLVTRLMRSPDCQEGELILFSISWCDAAFRQASLLSVTNVKPSKAKPSCALVCQLPTWRVESLCAPLRTLTADRAPLPL